MARHGTIHVKPCGLNTVFYDIMKVSTKSTALALLLPILSLIEPDQAWAIQSHGPPEGIYVHQMAHLFYAAALGYLFWDVGRRDFSGKGWRYLQIFCVFMILWNIVAFTGHWLGFYIDNAEIVQPVGYFSSQLAGPLSSIKVIYFLATLDHIFSLPAIFFLYLSLRSLYYSVNGEEEK